MQLESTTNEQAVQAEAKPAVELTVDQKTVLDQLLAAGHDEDQALEWVLDYVVADAAPTRFTVHDMSSANWVLRKLAECDADQVEVTKMLAEEIEVLRARAERILEPIKRKREFFEVVYRPQLEEFAREKLEGQKSRSVKMIHGTIGFRKNPARLVVDDEEKALQFAELVIPEAVKKSLLLTPTRKHIDAGGKVPGCHIEEGDDTFYVRPELPGEVS